MSKYTFLSTEDEAARASGKLDRLGRQPTFGQASLRRFMYILTAYWAMFWLMNGLDKFFNYPHFFGVTRNTKFVKYFATLDLPASLALSVLYIAGLLEVILGVSFIIGLCLLHRTRRITLLNLEVGLLAFLSFSLADILFGDRAELWEHGTYIVLVIVSYLSTLLIARELPVSVGKED